MEKTYIHKEIDKIMNNKKLAFPLNLAMSCAWIMGNLKGLNLKILDVSKKCSLGDFFILGSVTNTIQAQSMVDTIVAQLKNHNINCRSKEGGKESDWLLIDFGDAIVHIFLDSAREFYNIDDLWQDNNLVTIPQSYYFENPQITQNENKEDKNYF